MKKLTLTILGLLSGVVLVGCSVQSVKDKIAGLFQSISSADQQHTDRKTGLTQETVYERYDTSIRHIDLSNLELPAIPDLCKLVKPQDYREVYSIDLGRNEIEKVDTDLSCFSELKELNLSYNEISKVVDFGDVPMLEILKLHKNQLTSLANFPDLPKIKQLNLGYNQLNDVS